MENESANITNSDHPGHGLRERVVYVLPDEGVVTGADDVVSVIELWKVLWRGRWWIAGIAATSMVVAVIYVLLVTEWYRADVLLAPATENASPMQQLSSQLGGFAALAGVSLGGRDNAEAIAVLRSRDFVRSFIEEQNLVPVLLRDSSSPPRIGGLFGETSEEAPDIRDAVKFFREDVLSVEEDSATDLVRLRVDWTDAKTAAQWANELAERLNRHMRNRTLVEAETNIEFLQRELLDTNLVTLEQSIGRLLESELQRLMLARGNDEFAFRVLDRAEIPKERVRPRRTFTVILLTAFGGVAAALIQLLRYGIRRR